MPESITVNGQTTYRPGSYGEPDVSALAGIVTEINVLAVVADLPFLQAATPTRYDTQQALRVVDPSNDTLQRIAHLIYNCARDERVGTPSAVVLCNAQPTTQALVTTVDAGAAASVVLRSVLYGTAGNRVYYKVEAGTTVGRKLTVSRPGVSEWVSDDVESGNVSSFSYTGADASTMSMAYDPVTTGLRISYTDAAIPLGTFATPDYPFDGDITITPSAPPIASDFSALITGINKATGLADTETLTWPAGGGAAPQTSAKTWSSVTSIVFAETGVVVPTFTIAGYSFDLPIADYATADLFATRVGTFSGFTATNDSPEAAAIASGDVDAFTSATIKGVSKSLRADLRAVIAEFNRSGYVTAAKASAATLPPATAQEGYLSGGTHTATADGHVTTALVALEAEDVNIVAMPGHTAASRHVLLRSHCATMAGIGQNERNGWVGCASERTLALIKADAKFLNTRHLNLCYQHFDTYDQKGVLIQMNPSWLALICAAMQSGTPAATPLTRKLPNIKAVYNEANFDTDISANQIVKAGLTAITSHRRTGLQIERSVTTYLTDDNPIYSEMSANESVNLSIRDLRNALDIIVGTPGYVTTAARLQKVGNARLRRQANPNDLGLIKSFASCTVEDLGSAFRVTYSMAAIEPVNFLIINPLVERQPASAVTA